MTPFLLTLVSLTAALASIFTPKRVRTQGTIATFAGVINLVLALLFTRLVIVHGTQTTALFFLDPLGAILTLLLAIIALAVSWFSIGYLTIEVEKNIIGGTRVRQYFTLLHLFVAAMFFAINTTSPILMWIAIEATTLATAFLISFYNKPTALEAAWKYLTVNSIGLLLGFFGTLICLAGALTENGGLVSWYTLSAGSALTPSLAKIALFLILVGYGTKVGFVPMHTWLPDAHSKAPAPISALLSGMLLNIAFLAVLRYIEVLNPVVGRDYTGTLLVIFGTLSIVVAAGSIFKQKNYKRLLAYSSIEHMGIIAIGFGAGGAGVFVGLLHLIYHGLVKSALFLLSGNIFLTYSSTKIRNVCGVLTALPATGLLFMLGFLVAVGMPPFGMFVTKFSILAALIVAHPIAAGVALLGIVVIFVGFLRHVVAMLFGTPKIEPLPDTHPDVERVTILPPLLLLILILITSFYLPNTIVRLLEQATTPFL